VKRVSGVKRAKQVNTDLLEQMEYGVILVLEENMV
jgi:hypothetical protein